MFSKGPVVQQRAGGAAENQRSSSGSDVQERARDAAESAEEDQRCSKGPEMPQRTRGTAGVRGAAEDQRSCRGPEAQQKPSVDNYASIL
jgi:hypothetical protein